MKKILLSLLLVTLSLSAFESKAKKVGEIHFSMESRNVYEVCLNGVKYYLTDEGYKGTLAIKLIPDPTRPGRTKSELCDH